MVVLQTFTNINSYFLHASKLLFKFQHKDLSAYRFNLLHINFVFYMHKDIDYVHKIA